MKTSFLLILLFASLLAGAQTTVTGEMKNPDGTAIVGSTSNYARFDLHYCGSNQPRVSGSTQIPVSQYKVKPDASGHVSVSLYGNDVITCGTTLGGTRWAVTYVVNNSPGPTCEYNITGTTFDLNTQICDNVAPVVTPPTGDTVYARLDAGNTPFTGPIIAPKVNGVVNAASYASVELAGASCGVSKCIVQIPSYYSGTDCATTYRANVSYIDHRGSALCLLNSTTYNYTTPGNTHTMIRHQMRVTGVLPSGGGTTALYPITEGYNVTGDGTQNIDGFAADGQLTGTLTGSLAYLVGGEFASFPRSTGGTIGGGHGIEGYYTSEAGSTTVVNDAFGVVGLGCHNVLGAPPAHCYGGYFSTEASGTVDNYSVVGLGLGLMKYALLNGVNASGFDAEDNAGVAHRFLYVASDNSANVQAVSSVGLNLADSGQNTRVRVTSAGLATLTALFPNTAGAHPVGTNALPYSGIYIGGAATNNILLTGTATGARTATFPDKTGTVAMTSDTTPVYNAAGTQQTTPHSVIGSATLASASPSTVTVTLSGPAIFTSNASYKCSLTNETTAANGLKITYTDGSHFVITGPNTVTDAVSYICLGN